MIIKESEEEGGFRLTDLGRKTRARGESFEVVIGGETFRYDRTG